MKKILTLIFTLTLFASNAFAQDCSSVQTSNYNGSNRLNLTFANAAAATAFLNSLGSPVVLNPGGTPTTIEIYHSSMARIRLLGLTGISQGSGQYNGDIDFGSGTTCTFGSGPPLPVELISFEGTKKDRQINLNWEAASEINNEGFVIERGQKNSSDLEWNQLDFVRGNGTTDELQAYSFTDTHPTEGTNYYRLKQMDYDGKYEYSSVITVEYSTRGGSTIEIFPNPVKGQLTLTNAAGQATIYNAFGQAVKQLTINANQSTIQLADLLNGQYYLQVLQADGTVVTKQFSKVN